MINEKLTRAADYAVAALEKANVTKFSFAASMARKTEFNIDGGEFSLLRTVFNEAVSLTVYIDGKKGSAATNSLENESIDKALADAVSVAQSGMPDEAWDVSPYTEPRHFASGSRECDKASFFDSIEALRGDIERKYPLIMIEQLVADHKFSEGIFLNSNGVRFTSEKGCYGLDLMFSAHDGDNASSFFGTGVRFDSLDKPLLSLGSIASDLAAVEKQIYTSPFEGKFTGTALLSPAMVAEFLDMALGNFVSDAVIIEGISPWKDSLGKQVASPSLTVELAPSNESIVASESFTADGFVSEDFAVIKDGVLQSFLLSLYAANKTGHEREKNSSGALVIPAGDRSLDDIVAGIDRGILLGRFSGGQPGTNGDFSGVAKNSFLIENGRITTPVSEIMVGGNLADMLKNISAISAERIADGATLLPYIAFDGITVSGK